MRFEKCVAPGKTSVHGNSEHISGVVAKLAGSSASYAVDEAAKAWGEVPAATTAKNKKNNQAVNR